MKSLKVTVFKQVGAEIVPREKYVEDTKKWIESFKVKALVKPGDFEYEEGKVMYLDESGCQSDLDSVVFCEEYDGVIACIIGDYVYAESIHRGADINIETSERIYTDLHYNHFPDSEKHMIPCGKYIVMVEAIEA